MKLHKNPKASLPRLFMLTLFAFFITLSIQAQTTETVASLKEKAGLLVKQQKYTEALPYLEKLAIAEPDNAETRFLLGFALLAQAKVAKDKTEAQQLTIRARKSFVAAKERGMTEPVLDALITSLPEDGILGGKFSKNEEAENLMNEAEGHFAQGKLDEALGAYQKALKLDPNIYEAALFSGDVNTQKGKFAEAEIWYQKAIAINPNRETAYRYSATPLMKQQKYEQARDRYVEAFIVEPYSRFPVAGLTQWAQATDSGLSHPKIDVPEIKYDDKGDAKATININPLADDGSVAWMAYVASREVWRKDKFAKTFPNRKAYRHSLQEEADALRSAIKLFKEKKSKTPSEQLTMLSKLNDEGLLEAYILLALADEGIAEDHAEYLKQNRDKLRQYVLKYVIKK
jgi:tetratricopeptide (TPR) repeat protein